MGDKVTFPAGQDDISNVCPYLGLADDADSHATYPTEAHRCYRLENPTRIATGHQETYCLGANHVSCPVFRGEGIGPTSRAATAGVAAAAGRAESEAPRGRAPRQPREGAFGGQKERAPGTRGGGGGRSPALERRRPTGTLGPRPRGGGISMPVATIGLFGLAIVVLALAFLINRAVGGDGGDDLSQADRAATQFARTATQSAGAGDQTPAGNETPAGNQTPNGTATTPAGAGGNTTPTPAGGNDEETYTVQSGDFCGTIASDHDMTLEEFYELNPDINEACDNLNVGDEVRVR